MSFNFQNLKVWQKAIDFCDEVLIFADRIPQKEQFSLAEQLRRAAISVPTNIAEGSGRRSLREAGQFYNISRGSCAETVNLLVIAQKRNYLSGEEFKKFYVAAEEIAKMLYPLMNNQKLNSQISNLSSESGQSLVEMIVALAIILTGLIGALTLTISNLSASGEAGTRVIATNLAREGIDVVRNIRDTNWLKNSPWDDLLHDGADHTAIAVFNPVADPGWQLKFSPSAIDEAAAKLYLSADNLYLQDDAPPGGTSTLYARLLTLDPICLNLAAKTETITGGDCLGGEEKIGLRVGSEVAWTESGRSHSITLEDKLYNWR